MVEKTTKLGQITPEMITVTPVSCSTNLKVSEMVLGYLYHAPEVNLDLSNINRGNHYGQHGKKTTILFCFCPNYLRK